MTRTETIALDKIAWVKIYARRVKERNLASVLSATGGDLCFNGTIFSWSTYKPLCFCKAGGTYLCKPNYTVYGISWNTAADLRQAILPNDAANAITCVPLIVSGRKIARPNYQSDMGGRRPRTAIGMKEGRFAYFVTSDSYSPEGLRNTLFDYGWDTAIMLDGGGSTCFRDSAGKGFTCDKNRTIPHFIVIKRSDAEPEGEKPMVEINAYSKKADGSKKLSNNFRVSEFACKDGSDAILVAPRLVLILQTIRDHFGAAVTINSAYRTPAYNEKVGGAAQSQHCYGTAADITVKGQTPKAVAEYARKLMPDWGGVGIYSGFTHIDVREAQADWNG